MEKVVVAIPCLLQGGTEMQSLYLCQVLIEIGYSVQVVCYFEYSAKVVEEFKQIGCSVILLECHRSISAVAFISALRSFFKKYNPDIVHVQYMAPGALPIIAARLAGIKEIIATVHQPYTKSHGIKSKLLLRSASLLCNYFTCVSLAVEKSWFGSGHLIDESENAELKHCTIYNTVNIDLVARLADISARNNIRAVLNIEKKFVLGYYGRMREEKGFDILCKSFSELYHQYNNLALLVVGDGSQKEEMEKIYSKEVFWRSVHFVGGKPWKEAIPYLAAMDIVIIPSRFEGFGLSAVEAMAAGRPVIASRTGGLTEVVEHHKTGLLIEPDSSHTLNNAILYMMKNVKETVHMGEEAISSVERFSLNRYLANVEVLYLNGRRGV